MILRFLPLAVLAVSIACTGPASAVAKDGKSSAVPACSLIVKSAADAAKKADWIAEGNLDYAMILSDTDKSRMSLILSGMKEIKGGWPYKRGATGSVSVGHCFPGGRAAFERPPGKHFTGERVRLFGSKHADNERRRVFYMERVTAATPAIRPELPAKLTAKLYRQNARNPIYGGWHRAHSTGGEYSVDMPAPFEDVSAVFSGEAGPIAGFLMRATDANGFTFFAVREPNAPDAPMAASFDTAVMTKGSTTVHFKGVPAIDTRAVTGALVLHSRMFRVPGGTYMLSVSVPKDRERESVPMRERFYQSLAFD